MKYTDSEYNNILGMTHEGTNNGHNHNDLPIKKQQQKPK